MKDEIKIENDDLEIHCKRKTENYFDQLLTKVIWNILLAFWNSKYDL